LALIIDNAFGFGSFITTVVDGATTKLVKALAVLKVNTATTPNKREYNVFINFGFKIKNLDKNKGAGKKKSFFPEKTCAHKWITHYA
jgi:hypothetical protein